MKLEQQVLQKELTIVNLKQKEKVGEKQKVLTQVNHQQQVLILHLEVIQEAVQVEQIKVKVQVKVLLKIQELLLQKMKGLHLVRELIQDTVIQKI